ncbi:MAG TPA: ABC transporter permease [Bryobacteraceae bacterium]|jgi:sodium transport system permease protein
MRPFIVKAIFQREMLDMVRDRRALISMVVVPLFVFPLLISVMTRIIPRIQEKSQTEAKSASIAVHVTTPGLRPALEQAGMKVVEADDLKAAVLNKTVSAGVEETPGTPPAIQIYMDNANTTSTATGDRIREVLLDARNKQVRESLKSSGLDPQILTPYTVVRTNIAGDKKMSGAAWGSMLGYVLLLLMFTGGMYPVIDMTAGEKERKTIEAFLASPARRSEIVLGKTLAAAIATLATAALTLGSLVYSVKNNASKLQGGAGSANAGQIMGTIPLDAHSLALITAALVPMALFAASVMFAIALIARSYKEAQTYLMPLVFVVIFPALLGGLPGLEFSHALYLIPIFNTSQIIHGVLLGDVNMVNYGITLAANLVYAGIAFFLATRMFQDERVLFRS